MIDEYQIYSPPGYHAELVGNSKFKYRVSAEKKISDGEHLFIAGPGLATPALAIAEWNSIFGKGVA